MTQGYQEEPSQWGPVPDYTSERQLAIRLPSVPRGRTKQSVLLGEIVRKLHTQGALRGGRKLLLFSERGPMGEIKYDDEGNFVSLEPPPSSEDKLE